MGEIVWLIVLHCDNAYKFDLLFSAMNTYVSRRELGYFLAGCVFASVCFYISGNYFQGRRIEKINEKWNARADKISESLVPYFKNIEVHLSNISVDTYSIKKSLEAIAAPEIAKKNSAEKPSTEKEEAGEKK